MKNILVAGLLLGASVLSLDSADAARVVVRRTARAPRVRVTVRPGFPIRRALPGEVVVRTATVRVAPRVYLAPVTFAAVAVAASHSGPRVWNGSETLAREEGWTDFTMNVDRRGSALLLDIDGTAQISFAEVVFENGDAQVVDFNDRVHATGVYSLLDFRDGRKVDHVRVVAKADTRDSVIRLHLLAS